MLQTTPYRGEKEMEWCRFKAKQGNRLNRVNRSWFIESDGQTAVQTGPCFFHMERFFTLNGLWKWTVQGFPDQIVRSGPGLTTLLQPLPILDRPWLDISMDFIEGLPKSHGHDVILVVVDRLTRFVHFFSLHHPFTTTKVAAVFMQGVFKLHGMP